MFLLCGGASACLLKSCQVFTGTRYKQYRKQNGKSQSAAILYVSKARVVVHKYVVDLGVNLIPNVS